MAQKRSSRIVLLILGVILTLQPAFPLVAEATDPPRPADNSLDLMVAARGILLEEDTDDGSDTAGGDALFSVRKDVSPNSPAEQILVRLINATKKQLGDLEQACKEIRGSFSLEDQACEEKLSKAFCDEQVAKLRARLSFLRKVRGDRRKPLTKVWHSIKRAGANLWRNIGPVGRRFLRELGSDVKTVIMSGGSLHGGILRSLILKRARSIARGELEKFAQHGLQRIIGTRADAAGEDCEGLLAAESGMEPSPGACPEDWFDQTWEDIEVLLIAERRNCQSGAIYLFRECLLDEATLGACQDEAAAACQELYDAIPGNDAGGTVTMSGETIYGGAILDEVIITYPSGGGAVTGSIHYQLYDDVFICTIDTTAYLTGEFDLESCTMGGTADIEILYDGQICVSVCGIGPSSPAACPLTVSGTTVWDAELEDGLLSGAVGDRSCTPHCFGFQAPGYGDSP